jgi:hypothetical protein
MFPRFKKLLEPTPPELIRKAIACSRMSTVSENLWPFEAIFSFGNI